MKNIITYINRISMVVLIGLAIASCNSKMKEQHRNTMKKVKIQ